MRPIEEYLSGEHDQELRELVATKNGWSNLEWAILLFGTYTKGDKQWDHKEVPLYHNDLNACQPLLINLTKEEWLSFDKRLWEIWALEGKMELDRGEAWFYLRATPRQICVAWLLAKGFLK